MNDKQKHVDPTPEHGKDNQHGHNGPQGPKGRNTKPGTSHSIFVDVDA